MKSLAIQIRGVSYKPVDLHDTLDASSVILLRANNIDDGKINFDEVVFVDKKKVSQEQLLQKGDVLICASSGSKYLVGKAATVDFDREVTFGAFCKVVRPRNQEDADYISMYFQSPIYRREISSVAIGANINNIRNEHIDALSVRWPSAEKRQDSSSILRKVDLIIRRRKLELQVFDKLIKARFVEMFGNPVKNDKGFDSKLGSDVFKLSNGKFVPESKRFDSGIPVYGGNGISWYTNEFLFERETIVVGRVGFQSGNVHLVGGPLWISDNAMYISDFYDDGYDLQFLFATMEHIDFTRFQDAGDLKKITQKPFMQMHYIKPPIDMQQEYNAFVAQVDKSKAVVQKALDKAQLLFDSLMQKYFG